MVRNALVILLLQALHGIVQEKVDQNRIDPVRLGGLLANIARLSRVLSVAVLVRLGRRGGDAFSPGCFHFWVSLLDLALD